MHLIISNCFHGKRKLWELKLVKRENSITFIANKRLTEIYTVLQKYAHIGLKQNLLRSATLDIITRLFDNAAFVCVHALGRFSKDFSEVRGLRNRGFQLQVEWMTTVLCAEL